MTKEAISPRQQRMIADMTVRDFTAKTLKRTSGRSKAWQHPAAARRTRASRDDPARASFGPLG